MVFHSCFRKVSHREYYSSSICNIQLFTLSLPPVTSFFKENRWGVKRIEPSKTSFLFLPSLVLCELIFIYAFRSFALFRMTVMNNGNITLLFP